MVCSSQRTVSSPISTHSPTEQKVNCRVETESVKFVRLGAAKIKHERGVEGSYIVLSQRDKTKSVQVFE